MGLLRSLWSYTYTWNITKLKSDTSIPSLRDKLPQTAIESSCHTILWCFIYWCAKQKEPGSCLSTSPLYIASEHWTKTLVKEPYTYWEYSCSIDGDCISPLKMDRSGLAWSCKTLCSSVVLCLLYLGHPNVTNPAKPTLSWAFIIVLTLLGNVCK